MEAGREALMPRERADAAPSSAPGDAHATAYSPQTPRRLRRLALAFALVLLVGFSVVTVLRQRDKAGIERETDRSAAAHPVVSVFPVQADGASPLLRLPGQSAAWFESTIYGRVSGYVARWNGDIGDSVSKGQVLAVLDTPELDAQLAAAQARLNAAKAEVQVREAEGELATTTYARWRDAPHGVVSDQEREQKKADFDSGAARLNAARANVAVSQADVDRYAALAEFKRVVAPFDGTLVERRIDVGDLVTAGSTAATTPLYRVSQESPIRVFVDAPQRVSSELMNPGIAVQVRAANLPGRSFAGKVARTSRAINPQARTLRVEVDLPNADHALVPGMYVDVEFSLASAGLLQVPAAALRFGAGGPQVAIVDATDHLHLRNVQIARDDGNVVELASGVAVGDRVVLNLSSSIADGEEVSVRQAPGTPVAPVAPDPVRAGAGAAVGRAAPGKP